MSGGVNKMEINAKAVKELRELTGAGMMDCKKALAEAGGDVDKSCDILRTKGLADLAKRSAKATNEGLIQSYIHGGGRIGVLVEVNCETDFVSRNEQFQSFVHDVAMHIAAAAPLYVRREEVPKDLVAHEKSIYMAQGAASGKPEQIQQKMAEGRLEKFYKEICLMEQPFVKDPDLTITDLLGGQVAKLGENIKISRYTRYVLGEFASAGESADERALEG
jgi:elongation factor Ts